MNFAVGEIAIYWDQGSPNHRAEVHIIGPYQAGVHVCDSFTGESSRLDGHEIERRGVVLGPKGGPRARVFAAIQKLRKKNGPGHTKALTREQQLKRSSGEKIYHLSPAEQLEEA